MYISVQSTEGHQCHTTLYLKVLCLCLFCGSLDEHINGIIHTRKHLDVCISGAAVCAWCNIILEAALPVLCETHVCTEFQ